MGLWLTIAYFAGSHINTVYEEIVKYERYVLIALGLVVVGFVVRHVLRRRKQRADTGE